MHSFKFIHIPFQIVGIVLKWGMIVLTKLGIKNVQARIDFELYENIQHVIKKINSQSQPNDEKLNIQRVIVEALTDWVRKNRKDSFLSLSGLIKD